jgi:RNA polymerase sigma factor (sigma-70 family)
MKDLELTLIVKNNQLVGRRVAMGLSQKQIAYAADVDINTYRALEKLTTKPVRKLFDHHCRAAGCRSNYAPSVSYKFCVVHAKAAETYREAWLRTYTPAELYEWTTAAQKLAIFFEVEPEVLWPRAVQEISGGRFSKAVKTLDVADVQRMLGIDLAPARALLEAPDVPAERADLLQHARKALATLTRKEEKILRMRFGIGGENERTQTEIGEKLAVTNKRISQIEKRALRRLRHSSQALRIMPFHKP